MNDRRILVWVSLTVVLLIGPSCAWFARDASGTLCSQEIGGADKLDVESQQRLADPAQSFSERENLEPRGERFESHFEVDVTTGAYRRNWYPGDPATERIVSSPLSKEVRRLGLETPVARVWKPALNRYSRPRETDFGYTDAVRVGDQLVGYFQIVQASDDERRAILAEFLQAMRTQTPACIMDQGYILIEKLLGQHGQHILDFYPPAFIDYRATLRAAADEERRTVKRDTGGSP
jgi:hypothetical protein